MTDENKTTKSSDDSKTDARISTFITGVATLIVGLWIKFDFGTALIVLGIIIIGMVLTVVYYDGLKDFVKIIKSSNNSEG